MSIPIIGQGQRPSADSGAVKEIVDNGPKLRILYCWQCRTIEELPDFEGRPEDDLLLEIVIEPHQTTGVQHKGTLFKIPVGIWSVQSQREEIIRQMRDQISGGLDNLDPDYYNTRSTFYEDAMKCYSAHLRPTDSCSDWKSETKRLLPKTDALRKEAGLMSAESSASTRVYLCDFCPVKSVVMTKQRRAAGMYKE
jgi:hypothetical protein